MIALKGGPKFNSFRAIAFGRNMPEYLVPRILTTSKQEEFYVSMLYANLLVYNKYSVIGVEVCEDDSNKGADVIIKTDKGEVTVQVTRFTLSEYLHRKNVARKRTESIVSNILNHINPSIPVNITLNRVDRTTAPKTNKKFDLHLGEYVANCLKDNMDAIMQSDGFVNCPVKDPKINKEIPLITFQKIPVGFYSNFFGRNNVYLDCDFDSIGFDPEDIIKEAENIYNKKNGGKSKVLIVWAENFEILYMHKEVIDELKKAFQITTFDEVIFFSFFNRRDLFMSQPIHTAIIK